MQKEKVIEVSDLKKRFGTFEALKGVSFDLYKGETLGLLGPNGAGKTTTIQMLLGITTPTSGSLKIMGMDYQRNRERILSNLNFSSAYISLPEKLTVWENLKVFAIIYGISNLKQKIEQLMEDFHVSHLRNKPVGELSAGQKTRVSFAKALLNDPAILLLDEPMASLDPDAADRSRSLLKAIQKQRSLSILYTSHNMPEVELMCDRILFLHRGKVVAEGTAAQVTQKVLKNHDKESDLEKVFITLARSEDYEDE